MTDFPDFRQLVENSYKSFFRSQGVEDNVENIFIDPNGSENLDAEAIDQEIFVYPEFPAHQDSLMASIRNSEDEDEGYWKRKSVHEAAHVRNRETIDFSQYGEPVENELNGVIFPNPGKTLNRLARNRGAESHNDFVMECWLGDKTTEDLIDLLKDFQKLRLDLVERKAGTEKMENYRKYSALEGIDEIQASLAEQKFAKGENFGSTERTIPGGSIQSYVLKHNDVLHVDTEAISQYFVEDRYNDLLQKDEEQLLNEFYNLN